MKARIHTIFGKSITDKLYEFEFSNDKFAIQGFLSKEILSGSKFTKNKSIYFYFLNSRYISKIKKIDDIIVSIYRQYNKECNPIRIVHLFIKKGAFDINVGEFKDKFFIEDEAEIINFFSEKLMLFHEEKLKLYWVKCLNEDNNNSFNKKEKIVFSNSIVSNTILNRVNNNNSENKRKISIYETNNSVTEPKDKLKDEKSYDSREDNNNYNRLSLEDRKRDRLMMENLIVFETNKIGNIKF